MLPVLMSLLFSNRDHAEQKGCLRSLISMEINLPECRIL
jgi:hypothetical protein